MIPPIISSDGEAAALAGQFHPDNTGAALASGAGVALGGGGGMGGKGGMGGMGGIAEIGGIGGAMRAAGGDDDMARAMESLIPALWQSFAVILIGYACVKLEVVKPQHKQVRRLLFSAHRASPYRSAHPLHALVPPPFSPFLAPGAPPHPSSRFSLDDGPLCNSHDSHPKSPRNLGHGGLSLFVTKLALPALLFSGMASLDFSKVNWSFLLAVTIGKTAVFFLALGITMLLDIGKPQVVGTGAVNGIFVSQSNDFALGLPIFQPIFGALHPEYIGYLYLVAPISLIFLNPLGFLLMESDRKGGPDGEEGEEEEDEDGEERVGGRGARDGREGEGDPWECCDLVPEGEEAALMALEKEEEQRDGVAGRERGGKGAMPADGANGIGAIPSSSSSSMGRKSNPSHHVRSLSGSGTRSSSAALPPPSPFTAASPPKSLRSSLLSPSLLTLPPPPQASSLSHPPSTTLSLAPSPSTSHAPVYGSLALAPSPLSRVLPSPLGPPSPVAAAAGAGVSGGAGMTGGGAGVSGGGDGGGGGAVDLPQGWTRRAYTGKLAAGGGGGKSVGARSGKWKGRGGRSHMRMWIVLYGVFASPVVFMTYLKPRFTLCLHNSPCFNLLASPLLPHPHPYSLSHLHPLGPQSPKQLPPFLPVLTSLCWSRAYFSVPHPPPIVPPSAPHLLNPIRPQVPLGLAANYLFNHDIPPLLSGPFESFGAAFSLLSLFILSMSMADKTEQASDQPTCQGVFETSKIPRTFSPSHFRSHLHLQSFGAAFSPLSLFILGMSMADETEKASDEQTRLGPLLLSLALVAGKCLVLPLLILLLLASFQADDTSLSLAGLIYGSLPVTPATFFFACEYGLCQSYIGMATVLGTFLFGPLVYVLTQLAFLVMNHYEQLLEQTAADSGALAAAAGTAIEGSATEGTGAAAAAAGVAEGGRAGSEQDPYELHRVVGQMLVCCIALCWTSASVASLLCRAPLPPLPSLLRYLFHTTGHLASAVFTALLALSELLCSALGPSLVHRLRFYLVFSGWMLAALPVVLPLVLSPGWPDIPALCPTDLISCWYPFGSLQFLAALIIYSIAVMIIITSLSLLIWEQYAGLRASGLPINWSDLPLSWQPPPNKHLAAAPPLLPPPWHLPPPTSPTPLTAFPSSSSSAAPLLSPTAAAAAATLAPATTALASPSQVRRRFAPAASLASSPPVTIATALLSPTRQLGASFTRTGGASASPIAGPHQQAPGSSAAAAAAAAAAGASAAGAGTAAGSFGVPLSLPLSRQNSLGRREREWERIETRSMGSGMSVAGHADGEMIPTLLMSPSRVVATRWRQKTDLDSQNALLLFCCYAVFSMLVSCTISIFALLNGGCLEGHLALLLLLMHVLLSYSQGAVLFLAFGMHAGLVLPLVAAREWWRKQRLSFLGEVSPFFVDEWQYLAPDDDYPMPGATHSNSMMLARGWSMNPAQLQLFPRDWDLYSRGWEDAMSVREDGMSVRDYYPSYPIDEGDEDTVVSADDGGDYQTDRDDAETVVEVTEDSVF
ncbi:unnamed protein product [Closterium sp. NIES-64]|nr:unnamed protein product [Closterium sp. NIES-64]